MEKSDKICLNSNEIVNKLLPLLKRMETTNTFVSAKESKINTFADAFAEFDLTVSNLSLYDNDKCEWQKVVTSGYNPEEQILYSKLALFKVINQSGYRCRNSEGEPCFSNLCESAYEWAWNALGIKEDCVPAKLFYEMYDKTYQEYQELTGYGPPCSYLESYLKDEREQLHWGTFSLDDVDGECHNPIEDFADEIKREFYYEFDELIPSIMSDKIDTLVKKYKEILW